VEQSNFYDLCQYFLGSGMLKDIIISCFASDNNNSNLITESKTDLIFVSMPE
jgi:hypothetical protein